MKLRKYLKDLAESRNLHFSIILLVLVVITLWIINIFNISYPVDVTTREASGEFSVVGEGKVDVVPDTANINLGITVRDVPTVEEAQNSIDETNNSIISAMQDLGIEEEDISTSNYSINPSYNFEGNNDEITGYNGNATVNIKVGNLDMVSQVIETATANGANQVLGTNFSIENPEEFREQARDEAIENAREQANKLANNLGINLGDVTNMVENTPTDSPMPFMGRAESLSADQASGGPNLEPGTQTITSTVTLYFEKR